MNIIEALEENGIRVWRGGKNVSKGWIGIRCPFCGDNSNHLGIHLDSLKCRCWKCGPHSLQSVFSEYLSIPKRDASELIKIIDRDFDQEVDDEADDAKKFYIKLPPEAEKHFPKEHLEYLRDRGFPPLKTIRQYRLRAVRHIGEYKFRIIIPIILNGKIVSFTSRDITGKSEIRYKAANKEIYPNPKHYIYNFDSVPYKSKNVVLVEGPTDVWRLGAYAISFLGIKVHGKQLIQLARKKIHRLNILFDNDDAGRREAIKISKIISPFVKEVNIVSLKEVADPGLLTKEQGEILMRKLRILR
jgi:hypothetical protein